MSPVPKARTTETTRTTRTTIVWQYPKCSTCRKALKWLGDHDVSLNAIDLVASPPTAAKLRELWKKSGLPLAKMFNTAGESYRAGDFKNRLATMSEAEALGALAADGKLIKRPLIDAGEVVLVGYDEDDLKATFGAARRA